MASDIRKILSRLLDELDKEEKDELLENLKGKKLTGEELVAAIKELPPESRKEVREALADVKEEIEEEEEEGKSKSKKKDDEDEEEETDDGKKKKSKARTRPGRKSGRAYSWWIDEKGEIVQLDIARVYSGEDEPDEVEMLPVNEEDDEDEDEEEAV